AVAASRLLGLLRRAGDEVGQQLRAGQVARLRRRTADRRAPGIRGRGVQAFEAPRRSAQCGVERQEMSSMVNDRLLLVHPLGGRASVGDLSVRTFRAAVIYVQTALLRDQVLALPDHA